MTPSDAMAARHATNAITPAQVKAVHVFKGKLEMGEEDYRALLQERWGVRTCKDLSKRQAVRFLEVLTGRLGLRTPRRRTGRDERLPEDLPTLDQGELIGTIIARLGFPTRTTPGSLALCRRMCGQAWPQTRAKANQVIEGLKAMHARGWQASSSPSLAHGSPSLMPY